MACPSLAHRPVCWSQAEFTTATTLQLTGVTTTVQFHDAYEKGAPLPTPGSALLPALPCLTLSDRG